MSASLTLETCVRDFCRRDLQALAEIDHEPGTAAWHKGQFVEFVERPGTTFRVIVSPDRPGVPIGFFALEDHGDELYVANVAVAEEWRRRGIGALALRAIEDTAIRRWYARVTLDVQEGNLAAQLLYRKVGFRVVEIRKLYYGDQDGYRMVKECRYPRIG